MGAGGEIFPSQALRASSPAGRAKCTPVDRGKLCGKTKFFWLCLCNSACPDGRKRARRARIRNRSGGRLAPGKSDAHFPLKRSKELFQPDAQSDLPLLGPGLRPGRCGWVGSPEGLGRGNRNTLPGPLAPAARCRKAVLTGTCTLLRLATFPRGQECPCEKWSAAPLTAPCFCRRQRLPLAPPARNGLKRQEVKKRKQKPKICKSGLDTGGGML